MSQSELERARHVDPREASLAPVWRVLLVIAALQAAVAMLWLWRRPIEVDEELGAWVFTFLAMTAGLHLLTVVLLKQVLAHLAGGRYRTYCWLRWILVEGIALFGLLLAPLGFSPPWTGGFFALAGLLFYLERPTPADRALFVKQFQ